MTEKSDNPRFKEALAALSNAPLRGDTILMSREDYVETLRYAGVSEEEIERRLAALDEEPPAEDQGICDRNPDRKPAPQLVLSALQRLWSFYTDIRLSGLLYDLFSNVNEASAECNMMLMSDQEVLKMITDRIEELHRQGWKPK